MARYALVKAGVVVNTVVWDGKAPWADSPDAVLIPDNSTVTEGWTYNGSVFAPPQTSKPTPLSIEDRVKILEAKVTALGG